MPMRRASADTSPGAGRRTAGDLHAIEARTRRSPTEEEEAEERDRVFLDEIHRLPAPLGEYLYQALDERAVFVAVLDGAGVRLVRLRLEPFVLVGATTDESLLPRPLHSRFLIRERLEFYSREELEKIAVAGSRRLGVEVSREGARTLAAGARGTPRNLQGR